MVHASRPFSAARSPYCVCEALGAAHAADGNFSHKRVSLANIILQADDWWHNFQLCVPLYDGEVVDVT